MTQKEIVLSISAGMELSAAAQAERLAESIHLNRDKIDEVKHALVEACNNAFEHGQSSDRVDLRLRIARPEGRGEALEVTVADRGKGFDSNSVEEPSLEKKLRGGYKRGWGLKMIRTLMDEVEILSSEKGTTIVMRKFR